MHNIYIYMCIIIASAHNYVYIYIFTYMYILIPITIAFFFARVIGSSTTQNLFPWTRFPTWVRQFSLGLGVVTWWTYTSTVTPGLVLKGGRWENIWMAATKPETTVFNFKPSCRQRRADECLLHMPHTPCRTYLAFFVYLSCPWRTCSQTNKVYSSHTL